MCNPFKAVAKVFKAVTKSPIGKLVVAAAVSYFTAGIGASVLGATGLSASLSPALGTVLSHTLSGVAAGGITSLITGGDFGKGLLLGAAGGLVSGGVKLAIDGPMAGFGPQTPASSGAGPTASGTGGASAATAPVQQAGTTQAGAVGSTSGSAVGSGVANGPPTSLLPGTAGQPTIPASSGINVGTHPIQTIGTNAISNAPITAPAPVAAASNGMLSGIGGWIGRNPDIVAKTAGGAAQGMLGGLTSPDYSDIYADRNAIEREKIAAENARQAGIADSHSGNGLLSRQNLAYMQNQPARPTPAQRFDPASYGGQYVFDQQTGRVVFVRNATA